MKLSGLTMAVLATVAMTVSNPPAEAAKRPAGRLRPFIRNSAFLPGNQRVG
jgi:hypothetical protein